MKSFIIIGKLSDVIKELRCRGKKRELKGEIIDE